MFAVHLVSLCCLVLSLLGRMREEDFSHRGPFFISGLIFSSGLGYKEIMSWPGSAHTPPKANASTQGTGYVTYLYWGWSPGWGVP